MIQELLYTSHAGEGLRKGSGRGYCTVLSTQGMALNLANALENLSAYKHPFDIHDSRASDNPINYRHIKVRVGGVAYHILSRIADLRREHTGRTNKLAHHVVLPAANLPIAGPAKVLGHPGVCRTEWDGKVGLVPEISSSRLPRSDSPSLPCRVWKAVTGDAGWAAYVVDQLVASPNDPLSIIFPLGLDTLPLVEEALSLLPPIKRWDVTFSTYFTTLPPGTTCAMRWLLNGTPEADQIRRDYRRKVLDLTTTLGPPPASELADQARHGQTARVPPPPVPRATTGPQKRRAEQPTSEPSLEAIELELGPPELRDEEFNFRLATDSPVTRLGSRTTKRSKGKRSPWAHPVLLAGISVAVVCVALIVIYSVATGDSDAKANSSSSGPAAGIDATDAASVPSAAVPSSQSTESSSNASGHDTDKGVSMGAEADHETEARSSDDATESQSIPASSQSIPAVEQGPVFVLEQFLLPSIPRASSDTVETPVVLASGVSLAQEPDIKLIGLDELMVNGRGHLGFVVQQEDVAERFEWVVRERRVDSLLGEALADVARFRVDGNQLTFAWDSKATGNASLVDGLRWCVVELPSRTGKSHFIPLTLPQTSRRIFLVRTGPMRHTSNEPMASQLFRVTLDGDTLPRTERLSARVAFVPPDEESSDWECQEGPEANACTIALRASGAPSSEAPPEQLVIHWSHQYVPGKEEGPRALEVEVTCELKGTKDKKGELTKALKESPFRLIVSILADYDGPRKETIPTVHIADGIELKPNVVEVWQ